MVQHIVVLKWKAETTDAQVDRAFAGAEALLEGIDGVQRITLGRRPNDPDGGFTHAFVVNLRDAEALAGYLAHPVRERYVAETLAPIEAGRIEIDVPAETAHRHVPRAWEWGPTRHSAIADGAALRWQEDHDEL